MYVKAISLCKSDYEIEVVGEENGLVTGDLTLNVTENGTPITIAKANYCYAVREGSGSNAQIAYTTNNVVSITTADDWYIVIAIGDKVGIKRITVTAPTTTE